MKKHILILVTVIGFLLVAWLPCYGGEKPNLELHEKGHRQGEDLLDSYMSSALQNKEFKRPKKEATEVNIYVNCSTGIDKHNYGTTPEKPFKTINYAVSRVPYMRGSPDFFMHINIAAGSYYESVVVDQLDHIDLIGDEIGTTEIVGSEGLVTLSITSSKVKLYNLNVTNGNIGVNIVNSAVDIFGMAVQDSVLIGITATDTSTLTINDECTINNTGIAGIGVINSSNLTINSSSLLVSSNFLSGVHIANGSNLVLSFGSHLTVSDNINGLNVSGSSNAVISGDVTATENRYAGVNINDNSTAGVGGNINATGNGNGLNVAGSSNAEIPGNVSATGNSYNGIFITDNSHVTFRAELAASENQSGIEISNCSSAIFFGDVSADANDWAGMYVSGNSTARLLFGTISVAGNNFAGILLEDNSNASFAGNVSVTSNFQNGVLINNGSRLVIVHSGSELIVQDNDTFGIRLDQDSSITNRYGSIITVNNNGGSGIIVEDGSNLISYGGNTISDINFIFGARGTFNGVDTIGSITCDDTVMVRGNQTCP